MTIQRIEEEIRIRIGNMSAIKRRMRNVRTEQQRLNAAKELARVERQIADLQRQKFDAKMKLKQGGRRRQLMI